MKQKTRNKTVRIFIPSNWESLKVLKHYNRPLGDFPSNLKVMKYLLHCCHTARYYREDGAPFSYAKGASICNGDRKPFSRVKSTFLEHGIITCDNIAIKGKKSNHYRLGPLMEDVQWKLSHHSETFTLPSLNADLMHADCALEIDHGLLEQALDYAAKVRNWNDDRKDFWRWLLTEGWNNDVHGCRTGRIYGTWSRVPRELRGLFLINGEPVVEVDIRSAQPTMLVNLYSDRCSKECQTFIEIIKAGKFYEVIMKKAGIEDRDEAKEKTMQFLCGKVKSNPEIQGVFSKYLKELHGKIIEKIDANHRSLSWWLQGQESEVVVKRICTKYPVFSMHDGVICQASQANEIKRAMERAILEVCGIPGAVTIENKREALERHGTKPIAA